MNLHKTIFGLLVLASFMLSGCVVRTYKLTKDRVDQDLVSGNRGYLKGQAPFAETKERKTTRATQVVEIELHSPIKFEKKPKPTTSKRIPTEETGDRMLWGNRGFVTESYIPEVTQPEAVVSAVANIEKYTVQKNDTLQKISKKFYGTSKKWTKIYEANKDALKGPDKIYPGQIINVPVESLKEATENLK